MSGARERLARVAVGLQGLAGAALWAYAAHGAAPTGLEIAAPFLLIHAGVGVALFERGGAMTMAARGAFVVGPASFALGVCVGYGAPIGGALTFAGWVAVTLSALEKRRTGR